MEYLCDEIRKTVCVDYENEELQDIMKAVDILMNRFINELATKCPCLKFARLVLGGSMAEQTRLWRGSDNRCDLEFDYLAVMKSWPGFENFLLEQSIDGQVEVKCKIIDPRSKESKYVNVNPEVRFVLANNLHACINEKCKQNLCVLSLRTTDGRVDSYNGCQFCSVQTKTGTLKCTQTSLRSGKLHGFPQHLDRLVFLWTSKNRLLSVSKANSANVNILRQARYDLDIALRDRYKDSSQYTYTLPKLLEQSNQQPEEVEIEVDFHPVLEVVGSEIEQRLDRCVRVETYGKYILLPNIHPYCHTKMFPACKTQLYHLNNISQIRRLASFILKILAASKEWEFKRIPQLEKNEMYVLFPKSYTYNNNLWRISTCMSELEILQKTSKEHRLAFCVLKFLAMQMKGFDDIFPKINQYEAKIAVINHIKDCETPSIGAHVCVLSICNDVARCISVKSMYHPFLHMDLYENLRLHEPTWSRSNDLINFKVLLLILVNQMGTYTVTDLNNDLISICLVCDTAMSMEANYHIPRSFCTRDLLGELWEIVKRRKTKNSSRMELIKVMSLSLRKIQLRKIQFLMLKSSLDDIKQMY